MEKQFYSRGIGELLFDALPEGKQLGGAPVNFTLHGQRLGLQGYPASAVGQDTDGREILRKLTRAGLSTEYIQQVGFPTGTAHVSLDEKGTRSGGQPVRNSAGFGRHAFRENTRQKPVFCGFQQLFKERYT